MCFDCEMTLLWAKPTQSRVFLINHNQIFSEFSEKGAINLKKVASFFQDTIHFHPDHLQPKTLIFTIRALVE